MTIVGAVIQFLVSPPAFAPLAFVGGCIVGWFGVEMNEAAAYIRGEDAARREFEHRWQAHR